jgi:hypothetical protein
MILNHLTGLTELLTRKASSLPFASIENIGMTNVECLLFTATIFLFCIFLLKKKSLSVIYPLVALTIFLFAGTAREIRTRTTSEIIVYNTPGHSTIGIRTGRILNLYSDTTVACPEVRRHCSTIGLKMNMVRIGKRTSCLKAGKKVILITRSLDTKALDIFTPDIVILTGSGPEVKIGKHQVSAAGPTVIAAEGSPHFSSSLLKSKSTPCPVFIVRKSGAFKVRI